MPFTLPFVRVLCFLGLLLAALAPGWAVAQTESAIVKTPQVTAELLAYAPQGVTVGPTSTPENPSAAPVWVGLQLTHQPGWHTYWKNSGDSGEPTQLQWTLPPGVTAGDIAWPLPRQIPIGDLVNYGYEGTVLLPVPLTVTPQYRPGPLGGGALPVHLQATWLVCRRECIPQQGQFDLRLPIAGSTALAGAAFEAALAAQPRAISSGARATVQGQRLQLRVTGLPARLRGTALTLFPETPGIFVTAAQPAASGAPLDARTWRQAWDGAAWTADLPLSPDRADAPATLPLVLQAGGPEHAQGWRVEAKVEGAWPPAAPRAALSPALTAALQANAAAASGAPGASPTTLAPTSAPLAVFLWTLLGAFAGGVLLNLMPCVFPILAVKVLGFVRHARDARARRLSALAYGVGVVASFLLLGALMLALRAAGGQLGWGFQLQSPAVVAALAALFTAIGLNLAGMFEAGLWLPNRVLTLQARHPVLDAALSGVLAVAVASPCTAPFMGASLGLTVSMPQAQALLVFAVLGAGMALPYLAASWWPALARRLPRPGAWMDVLRRLLAFPMFGTVAWLLWVLGQQSGIDGAAALLALLVALALLLWTLGLQGRLRRWLGALALAVGAALLALMGPLVTRPLPADAPLSGQAEGRWQPWSPARVQAALAQGRPVFVDFTAAWCVTCQYNKKTTLSSAQVLATLDAARVQTFRADWTRRDATITAELQKLGRSGVPVYVLQAPGKPAMVLSEILSVGDVMTALGRL